MTLAGSPSAERRWPSSRAPSHGGGAAGHGTSDAATTDRARTFRPDIEGLRGIAILLVLLFHFHAPGSGGGFAGVDVFFVISGYLMTLIISRGLSDGGFSILQFYLGRLTRVAPALVTLCVALIAFGYVALPPSDYARLLTQTAAASSFLSNILFWKQASYFDPVSEEKWLLNTWSLGVEFQFYLLYPLFLIAARRLFPRLPLWSAIAVGAAASLGLSTLQATASPIAAFFLLPSRLWELLVGGLLVFAPLPATPKAARAAVIVGVLAVVAVVPLIDTNTPWPGWRAGLPVAGTMAIIWANARSTLIDNPPLRMLGRWSYSIYLWHWPIACLMLYREAAPAPLTVVAHAAAAILAGWLSYTLCERPRMLHRRSMILSAPALLLGLAIVTVVSATLWRTGGLPDRVSPAARIADSGFHDMSGMVERCFSYRDKLLPPCRFGDDSGKPSVILIGDSHSAAIADALAGALERNGGSLLYEGASGCPTLVETRASTRDAICEPFKRAYLDPLIRGAHPGVPVLITNYWYLGLDATRTTYITADGGTEPIGIDGWRRRLTNTVCGIARTHPTYVMLPMPEYPASVPRTLARLIMAGNEQAQVSQPLAQYLARRAPLVAGMRDAARTCGAVLLDPQPAFCDGAKCMASEGARPLYYDSNHPSLFGSRRLMPLFETVFAKAATPYGPESR